VFAVQMVILVAVSIAVTNHSSFTTASADKASLELRSLPSIAERLQS
jgi:hypothetical protein